MKTLTIIMMLMISATVIKAQDIITLKNGTDIKAMVTEISDTEIRYKKFENQSGPTYVVNKTEVFMITYQNGSRDVINSSNAPVSTSRSERKQRQPQDDNRIRYGGPRLGVTYFTEGSSLKYLAFRAIGNMNGSTSPFITQFGWQFETRFFTLENGASGLVEFVPMIGGMERGLFLPSASALVGFRTKNGHEFGVGPNLSRSGFGMVLAVGSSFTVGKVCFPVNIAYTPSVTRMESGYTYDPNTQRYVYYNQPMATGHRISLLIGFNTRRHN